jgi:hypothetical protein
MSLERLICGSGAYRVRMSWEYSKYEALCENCGRTGFCIQGSDDWNRSSTTWEGFNSTEPSASSVARKRLDSRDRQGKCECGSSDITVGRLIETY